MLGLVYFLAWSLLVGVRLWLAGRATGDLERTASVLAA